MADINDEEADVYGFDLESANKIAVAVRQELARVQGENDGGYRERRTSPINWVTFVNNSGETMPGSAVMAIDEDLVMEDDVPVLSADKPSSTFSNLYAINGPEDVEDGECGLCAFEGPIEVLYDDDAAPGVGEGWGPQPDSWKVAQGFPSLVRVLGITDEDNAVLYGTVSQITTLLCKATADLSNNAASGTTASSAYKIYTGAQGSEADGGWTTVPAAYNRSGAKITSGSWFVTEFVDNGWECCPSGGTGPRRFKGTLGGAITNSSSTVSVGSLAALDGGSVPGGGTVTANNYLGWAGSSSDPCIITEDNSSGSLAYLLELVKWSVVTEVVDVLVDAPNKKIQKQTRDFIGKPNAAANSAADVDAGTVC